MSTTNADNQPTARSYLFRWVSWFLFFSTPLVLLTNIRYFGAVAIPLEPLPLFFIAVSLLGHFAALSFLPFLILAPLILLAPRKHMVLVVAVLLESAVTTVLLLDCVVFSLYRFHLNGMVWELLSHGAAKQILPVTSNTYTTGGGIITGVIVIQCIIAALTSNWIKRPFRGGKYLAFLVIISLLTGHILHAWADAAGYNGITRLTRIFPAYPALTMQKSFERWGVKHIGVDSPASDSAAGGTLRYPLADPGCRSNPANPNIVYIVIDSWRFDMLNAEASPNILRFSQGALRFTDHSAAANTTQLATASTSPFAAVRFAFPQSPAPR